MSDYPTFPKWRHNETYLVQTNRKSLIYTAAETYLKPVDPCCPRTVVHPKARIIAEAGPIVIGEGNLIEEQALIINSYPENITPESEVEPKTMTIGMNNVFEVGCVSQALKIGDNNVIESKADVGRNVILTSGCIIGAFCQVNTCEVIPENTVIYGSGCMRRVQTERPQPQTLQLDFLMKILPNYHHLKKTVKAGHNAS
uniref:Dynactin subunit 6 n=1 Tax=Labrus bergylta TaxID=56723 RepID=A0A3Q3H3U7_9LABR